MKDSTKKLIGYIEFINKRYPKRKITAEPSNGGKFIVRIDRDDFGSWSADNGYAFDTEEEFATFLSGLKAFYDCISHTTRKGE